MILGALESLNERGRKGRYMSRMSSALPASDIAFAASDVACWLGHLSAERRLSPKTVEAYERDVRQFLVFLCGHFGKRVTLPALSRLKPLDVRAFMAARRADGVSSRSLMRMLAGARSFARFLERNGKGNISALSAVRSPKLTRTLPKVRYLSVPEAGRYRPALSNLRWRGCAVRSACRKRRRRMRCAIHSRHICWLAAATCAPSKSCSGTPPYPRRKCTLPSIPNVLWKSTATRIRE